MPLVTGVDLQPSLFSNYLIPSLAQAYIEQHADDFYKVLLDSGYTGTYSLHSGFNPDTVDLLNPEQDIYLILDADFEISDELYDLLQQKASTEFTVKIITAPKTSSFSSQETKAIFDIGVDKSYNTPLKEISGDNHDAQSQSGGTGRDSSASNVKNVNENTERSGRSGSSNSNDDNDDIDDSSDSNGDGGNSDGDGGGSDGSGNSGGGGGNGGGGGGKSNSGGGGGGGGGGGSGSNSNGRSDKSIQIPLISHISTDDGKESFTVSYTVDVV
ncbi:hypothetical protein C0993_000991, partial [Termitomyces sp. T159_Od127]